MGQLVDGLFAAESFSKSFGENVVLKAASCVARPGSITALLGRNGSGKTTLLRCALGLTPADNGVTHWDGDAFLKPALHRLAADGLFFVPAGHLLARCWTVRTHERLAAGGREAPMTRDPFEISEFRGRKPRKLSGGERRRAELSVAVARRPRCLIADEPFLGLAPRFCDVFCAELRRLAGKGCAVLVTGHEVERILSLADSVTWVVAGGTYQLGSPDEARSHPEFVAQYLGPRGGAVARGDNPPTNVPRA